METYGPPLLLRIQKSVCRTELYSVAPQMLLLAPLLLTYLLPLTKQSRSSCPTFPCRVSHQAYPEPLQSPLNCHGVIVLEPGQMNWLQEGPASPISPSFCIRQHLLLSSRRCCVLNLHSAAAAAGVAHPGAAQ